jgi:hypothetical protein
MKPESKFWLEVKKNIKEISLQGLNHGPLLVFQIYCAAIKMESFSQLN